ncbi:MAG: hypothetical protein KC561_06890, partial [Myxococcales bacterium]|nr:hypothetical protein [Myxococcales bacterium]
VEVSTGRKLGKLSGSFGDLAFPEYIKGWTDSMDCRFGRYLEMDLDEMRHTAKASHKSFIVVNHDQV